ncbi:hypothetical protein AALD74_10530 [Lachnospiraceae bacterium 48-21]|jgi:hypothetical protein
MTANTYKPGQITALYARLSQEDTLEGDSNSIVNQDAICQGYFLPYIQICRTGRKTIAKLGGLCYNSKNILDRGEGRWLRINW